jgi:hypothetical protein
MAHLPRYDGTFSFTSSRLYDNIRRVIFTYDEGDPKTWPYVTLSTIEKHCPYQGYPDLPTGVAYQREAMKRYEDMYSPEERNITASVNGSLHQRYPFNYDKFGEPKEKVGMSGAEYRSYMATIVTMPSTPRVREEWEDTVPDSAIDCNTPPAYRGQKESTSPTLGIRARDRDFCTNKKCTKIKREAARLRGELFDKESQLMGSQGDLKEYETSEGLRRRAMDDAKYQLEREKRRGDAAEKECMLRMEINIKLLQRMRDLEMKVKQMDDLDTYCAQLEAEIEKRGRDQVSSSDEDEEDHGKPSKRMRPESTE